MTHEEWLAQVSDSLKNDPIWKFEAYPKSLFLQAASRQGAQIAPPPPPLISNFSSLILL